MYENVRKLWAAVHEFPRVGTILRGEQTSEKYVSKPSSPEYHPRVEFGLGFKKNLLNVVCTTFAGKEIYGGGKKTPFLYLAKLTNQRPNLILYPTISISFLFSMTVLVLRITLSVLVLLLVIGLTPTLSRAHSQNLSQSQSTTSTHSTQSTPHPHQRIIHVAFCVVGLTRSFFYPQVYNSILRNVVEAMSSSNSDNIQHQSPSNFSSAWASSDHYQKHVFFDLGSVDVPRTGTHKAPFSEARYNETCRRFQPVHVHLDQMLVGPKVWDKHANIMDGFVEPVQNVPTHLIKARETESFINLIQQRIREQERNMNKEKETGLHGGYETKTVDDRTPYCGLSDWSQQRYPMSLYRANRVFQSIKSHESRHNLSFHWIVLLRPDIAWPDPLPHLKTLNLHTVYGIQTWPRHSYQRFGDQFAIVPRHLADLYFDAVHAVTDCRLYQAGFQSNEKIVAFNLLRAAVKFVAKPFFWILVRFQSGPECHRMKWIDPTKHNSAQRLYERCMRFKNTSILQ